MVTGILSVSGAPEGAQAVSPTYLSLDLASRVHGEPGNIMPSASSAPAAAATS